ncbi:DUF3108 domain-containing protein [Hellea sp.]|nr:DUF3108 domain-containing protein [Hellea sp.]
MKRILTTALLGLTATGVASASFLDQSRNMAVLNDGNIMQKIYNVPQAGSDATEFDFRLKGYVFGFKMITANYTGWYGDKDYAVYSDIKTSGLGAMLKKLEIWAVSVGTYTRSGLTPDFHIQQNLDKKNRRVEMNYNNNRGYIHVAIQPPIGSQGVPAATPEERYTADDTISAVLNLMMRGQKIDGPVCSGAVRVFDSKQHYNLRMENKGTDRTKFEGKKVDTIECHVYYEPISGFDPEDLPDAEEGGTPIVMQLKAFPEIGLYVPVRFTYKISSIKAVIKLDEMVIKKPGGVAEVIAD